ncbi:MAG: hypothetical protein AAGP08_19690, partial [Pseudomonadota bacterium]
APLLASGILVGIFLRAPGMYLSLWAIRLAGAQSYTAAIVMLPMFGMVFEQSAFALGLLDTSRFSAEVLGFAVLVVLGTLAVLAARWRAKT